VLAERSLEERLESVTTSFRFTDSRVWDSWRLKIVSCLVSAAPRRAARQISSTSARTDEPSSSSSITNCE
jgi:hypothetical protein